ncbi:MAG: flagellar motor switch protein FliN [Candidatus Korobacteraceae bacterium]
MSNHDQEQASGQAQPDQDRLLLLQQTFIQHFAQAASSVLSQIAGTALQALPAPLQTATEAATLIRVELGGALEGLCEIALSEAMTAQFAALLTGEIPEPAAGVSEELREAAAELVQQICGNAADRLRANFGPLELKPRLADREPAEDDSISGARHLLRLDRGSDALEFELHLLRLTSQAKPPEAAAAPLAQPAAPPAEASAASPASLSAGPATTQYANRNLDLLLDIELGVTLRFGTRQMLLKDILELSSGSVVELDRRVEEPVDLLIDGRVIAQGEVVLVEGNYGLRILQVATQGEKLACLP